ncbi:MAG TPA: hypothetical protein DCX14_01595 [Flavobacteriales bacterium]|nr:DUF4397 domain-containing protein [Flavobacteriales bacterium]HAW18851.1 hypothetical protein [Flavobacteriales bacterium]
MKRLGVIIICTLFFILNTKAQTLLQIAHCSGDTALSSVDVWLDSVRIANDIDYRHSTNYRSVSFNSLGSVLSITPSNSIDTTGAFFRDTVMLIENSRHQIFLHGNVSGGYNPSVPLDIDMHLNSRVASGTVDNSDVAFFNGITDMGAMTLFESSVVNDLIILGLDHGHHSAYTSLEGLNYLIQLQDSASSVLREFKMSLAAFGLRDSAFTIAFTGFDSPSSNNNGAPIRMELVPNQGGPFESFSIATASIQVIHNSIDPGLSAIDIYSQENLITDNLNFRSGTSYLEIPSGIETEIGIARGSATGVQDTLISKTVSLTFDESYILVIQGMDDSSLPSFKPLSTLFFESKLQAATSSITDIVAINGCPDLLQIDIKETSIIDDYIFQSLDYGTSSGYNPLPSSIYQIELRNAVTNALIKAYSVDLSDLGGTSKTWVISGLSDTLISDSTNNAGIWVHGNTSGKLVEMSNFTGIQSIKGNGISVFPNPTSEFVYIKGKFNNHTYRIVSSSGVLVKSGSLNGLNQISLESLPSGQYHLQLTDGKSAKSETIILVR